MVNLTSMTSKVFLTSKAHSLHEAKMSGAVADLVSRLSRLLELSEREISQHKEIRCSLELRWR